MMQFHGKNMPSWPGMAASALMIVVMTLGLSPELPADTITLSSANSPLNIETGTADTVVVPSEPVPI